MAIRENYEVDDIQSLIYKLLLQLSSTTSPWTAWAVIRGYPEEDVFSQFSKPLLYVEMPIKVSNFRQQGGGKTGKLWELKVGAWDDRKTGGPEEINIISGRMVAFLGDPKSCHTTTFDVTLGTTAYTKTTILAQGLRITDIIGPRVLFAENVKEFRAEFDLFLRT